jgi:hypothetical protein
MNNVRRETFMLLMIRKTKLMRRWTSETGIEELMNFRGIT